MKSNSLVDKVVQEAQVVQGEATKGTIFSSERTFPDEASARQAFGEAVTRLLTVNGWSNLSMLSADFSLHDASGQPKPAEEPTVGDYIRIELPGPMPENWVRVTHTNREENRVAFTVHPSESPLTAQPEVVSHFFQPQASSTFQVELLGTTLRASEVGQDEAINNQGQQAGDRSLINTAIAEVGWLFYQKLQWKLLTDYLVHG